MAQSSSSRSYRMPSVAGQTQPGGRIPDSAQFMAALTSRKPRHQVVGRTQASGGDLVLDELQPLQALFLGSCEGIKVTVPGKAAQITLDRCSDLTLECALVAGAVELIKCSNVTIKSTYRCCTITSDMSTDCSFEITHHVSQEDIQSEATARKRVADVNAYLQSHPLPPRDASAPAPAPQAAPASGGARPSESELFVKEASHPWVIFSSRSSGLKVRYSSVPLADSGAEPTQPADFTIPRDAVHELGDGARFATRIVAGKPVTLECVNNYGDV
ncbi:hypothetical protein CAOG_06461 [Capsaspora owczarzaki ATCC 30864]|uniref:C-CAP/cofactor C-like domain-containing protein n=1 Tax=Capsaspora owczarzaki (strain ATCC 30864) TaxID=595528 RepID=A0A0D2VWY0_CAPO3|nr:hypothetical protein CAOG_06461 [Capsaspora owczarzaki ATCC 30864]KJE96092.1 hypothetical protein CAOG_006461 [Capsaspora owczarzaki ATCC 30864]|eukprot:XP_004345210.1 hypothetical protein CAOG_06461 [Capsaspora owczarzaki ATCC 30864]